MQGHEQHPTFSYSIPNISFKISVLLTAFTGSSSQSAQLWLELTASLEATLDDPAILTRLRVTRPLEVGVFRVVGRYQYKVGFTPLVSFVPYEVHALGRRDCFVEPRLNATSN